jgi:hypothetical protein
MNLNWEVNEKTLSPSQENINKIWLPEFDFIHLSAKEGQSG